MKTITVEYGRVFNMGNYENLRLSVTLEVPDGATSEGTFELARAQIWQRYEAEKAWQRAYEEAERKQYEPWKVTPEMVAEAPTLLEKAHLANLLVVEHKNQDVVAGAHQQALERFGVDLAFVRQEDGTALADAGDGLYLVWRGANDFTALFEVAGEGKPRQRPYVRTIEDLGAFLANLSSVGTGPDDSPF